jgi:hypothetical protein
MNNKILIEVMNNIIRPDHIKSGRGDNLNYYYFYYYNREGKKRYVANIRVTTHWEDDSKHIMIIYRNANVREFPLADPDSIQNAIKLIDDAIKSCDDFFVGASNG